MRLFIAIPLPPDVAHRASALLPPALPGLRRVQPENLHVTLAFLGETPESRLPDVAAAAEHAARAVRRFRLVFDRTGRFPERGRPRVLWLGFADGLPCVQRLGEGVYRAVGMSPLRVRKEIDGFVADRLLEALWREALWLVADGVATVGERLPLTMLTLVLPLTLPLVAVTVALPLAPGAM